MNQRCLCLQVNLVDKIQKRRGKAVTVLLLLFSEEEDLYLYLELQLREYNTDK